MALASGWAALRGLPRPLLYGLAGALALLLLWRWHDGKVDAAFVAGGQAQAVVDRDRIAAASAAAVTAQRERIANLATRQARISKGTDDALDARADDLDRRHDDLRLRWAAYRADRRRAGEDRSTALSGTAASVDDAACAAEGWVAFDAAAAAAHAADAAIAKDDAWIAWAQAQGAVWPE